MDFKTIILMMLPILVSACAADTESGSKKLPREQVAVFTSTDIKLQKSYEWARKTALSYTHDGADPVGLWYDAAYPNRESFCMRNVAHQSVGAQILGLTPHNKNMFSRLVENISEGKDWCGYWEINRYNKPTPADYSNDREFWYNLGANFDVLQACLKMYRWTGDEDYVSDRRFADYYGKSINEYVKRWCLSPEDIMSRSPYMNYCRNFDLNNKFHTCRGIPSYEEEIPDIAVGVDLIAALYAGFKSAGEFAGATGNDSIAGHTENLAAGYRQLLEEKWWDAGKSCYHSHMLSDGKMESGNVYPYVLWFGATDDERRQKQILSDIRDREWTVEYLTYFPALFYHHGYISEAYDYLTILPTNSSSHYPEVSFGIIEGCVCGAMGFNPDYKSRRVATAHKCLDDSTISEIRNVRVFDGYMSVLHSGIESTELSNDTSVDVEWEAAFKGDYAYIESGGSLYPAETHTDLKGNVFSKALIPVAANAKVRAEVVRI